MIQSSRELLPVPLPTSWSDAGAADVEVSVTTASCPSDFHPVDSLANSVAFADVGPDSAVGPLSAGLNRVFGRHNGDIKYLASVWVEGCGLSPGSGEGADLYFSLYSAAY